MSLSQTITTAPEPTLSPELEVILHSSLTQYAGLLEQIALLQELADAEKQRMEAVLTEAGLSKLSYEAHTLTIVRGTTSRLDKKKLVAQGVSEAMIAAATTTKPKKPYLMVRKAGEAADPGDDE